MEDLNKQHNVRCSESQLERWRQAADAERRPLSQWIRITLDDAADELLEEAESKKKDKKK